MRPLVSALVCAALVACGGDSSGPSVRVASIFVSTPQQSIAVGDKVQLTAVAIDSVGNTVSTTFQWSTSSNVVAAVSNTGLLTAVTAGNVTISASAGGATGTLGLTIRATANLAVVTMPPGDVFTPFQVTIPVAGTVRWEFPQRAHNVIFEKKAGVPADIQQVANTTVSRTFNTAGTFPYDCTLHPGMSGEVVVRP
ncbi:MAG TPA: Ig-like domain-containing protein [Gemmatimonadaceae bacterium]|nr:Ig-like domain-containing protein [Gemmatimonadaceae bacterium]